MSFRHLRVFNRPLAALTLAAAVALGASQAQAGLLIDAGVNSFNDEFLGGDYVAGSEFTTAGSLTIRSLGWLDVEGDGLLFDHRVGLWDVASQTLLASVLVTSASATVASAYAGAQWFMEDIIPIVIGAGTYRVAGEVGADLHNAASGDQVGNGVTVTAGYVRTDFPDGGFAFPNLTFSSNAIRATAADEFYSGDNGGNNGGGDVPEPATLGLLGLGLLGLGFARRRRG